MKSGLAMVAIGLTLASCGKPAATGTGNGAAASTEAPDPYEGKIAALTEQQRNLTFYKAIYDADYQCAKVVKVTDRPRDDGHKAWEVTCSDTGDFYVTLRPGGVFTVSGTPSTKTRLPEGTKILPPGTK